MSLVMAFATEDFTVMSGDIRRVYVEDDSIYFDDCPKVFSINSRVLGGFTGDYDVTIHLRNAITKVNDNATVEAVARFIKKELVKMDKSDIQQTVILAGISDSGKIVIFNISWHNDFKIIKTKPKPGEIKWEYAFPFVDPGEYIQSKFGELNDCNPDNIAAMAKAVNENVSDTDNYVSKQCNILYMVK